MAKCFLKSMHGCAVFYRKVVKNRKIFTKNNIEKRINGFLISFEKQNDFLKRPKKKNGKRNQDKKY